MNLDDDTLPAGADADAGYTHKVLNQAHHKA
jgi:hypothetical protein